MLYFEFSDMINIYHTLLLRVRNVSSVTEELIFHFV